MISSLPLCASCTTILYISFRRNKSDNEELNQSVITTALVFNTEDYITLRSNLSKIETMSDK